jgi:bifunctional DNase/RNase
MEIPVHVWRVGRDPESQYLLVFRDDQDNPLPMTIGPCEAFSIWAALRAEPARPSALEPMTHDLLCALIGALGGRLLKVVVDDYWNRIYYAKLHIEVDSDVVTVDSRPSDAVAIALRLQAPLYVVDSVLEAANQPELPSEPRSEEPDPWDETEDL